MTKVTITCKCGTANPSKYDAETLFCHNCGRDLKPALDRLHTMIFLAIEDPEELKRLQEMNRKNRKFDLDSFGVLESKSTKMNTGE